MIEKFKQKLESMGYTVLYKRKRTRYWIDILNKNTYELLYHFPVWDGFTGKIIDMKTYVILPEVIVKYTDWSEADVNTLVNKLLKHYEKFILKLDMHYESHSGGSSLYRYIKLEINRYANHRELNINKFRKDPRLYDLILDWVYTDFYYSGNKDKYKLDPDTLIEILHDNPYDVYTLCVSLYDHIKSGDIYVGKIVHHGYDVLLKCTECNRHPNDETYYKFKCISGDRNFIEGKHYFTVIKDQKIELIKFD